jgi:hypothetical protein
MYADDGGTLQNNSTITQLIVREDVTEGIRELG